MRARSCIVATYDFKDLERKFKHTLLKKDFIHLIEFKFRFKNINKHFSSFQLIIIQVLRSRFSENMYHWRVMKTSLVCLVFKSILIRLCNSIYPSNLSLTYVGLRLSTFWIRVGHKSDATHQVATQIWCNIKDIFNFHSDIQLGPKGST